MFLYLPLRGDRGFSDRASGDEDIDPGQEGGEAPLPQQFHLHIDEEVLGLTHLSLQVHSPRKAVELARAEVALFVALDDADDNVVA